MEIYCSASSLAGVNTKNNVHQIHPSPRSFPLFPARWPCEDSRTRGSATKELGMDAIALTDHGVLYGAVEFYKAAKKAGVKPILGVETYVAPRDRFSKEGERTVLPFDPSRREQHGLEESREARTKAHLEGFYYRPRVDKDLLREHHEGLIALSACLGGEIGQALLAGREDDARGDCAATIEDHLRQRKLFPRDPKTSAHPRFGKDRSRCS